MAIADYPVWIGGWWASWQKFPRWLWRAMPCQPEHRSSNDGTEQHRYQRYPRTGRRNHASLRCIDGIINQTGISLIAPKVDITAASINLVGITDINQGALKVT